MGRKVKWTEEEIDSFFFGGMEAAVLLGGAENNVSVDCVNAEKKTGEKKETAGNDAVSEYLNREERILSLMREKKIREYVEPQGVSGIILKTLEKMNGEASELAVFDKLTKAVGKYLMALGKTTLDYLQEKERWEFAKEIAEEKGTEVPEEPEGRESYQELKELLKDIISTESGEIEVHSSLSCYRSIEHRNSERKDRNTFLYLGCRNMSIKPVFSVYGFNRGRLGHSTPSGGGAMFYDLSNLATYVICKQVRQYAEENEESGTLIREIAVSQYAEHHVRCIGRCLQQRKILMTVPKGCSRERLFELFRTYGEAEIVDRDDIPVSCRNSSGLLRQRANDFLSAFVTGTEITADNAALMEYGEDDVFNILYESCTLVKLAFSAMLRVMCDYELAEKRNAKYNTNLGKQTAKVYETLKNHTERNVLAMVESPFNKNFGFVEYDHEIDVEAAGTLYEDFSAVNHVFFNDYDAGEIAVRFRKLGRHHAIGLYFPTLRCLCVDLRHPRSMVHEYFHMYDHEHGDLSMKPEFYELRQVYGELLRDAHKKLSEEEQTRMKNSVYDLDYYLTPTEIFARLGEIFISRLNHVRNGTVGNCEGFAYPHDEKLERLTKEYYEKLLGYRFMPPAIIEKAG